MDISTLKFLTTGQFGEYLLIKSLEDCLPTPREVSAHFGPKFNLNSISDEKFKRYFCFEKHQAQYLAHCFKCPDEYVTTMGHKCKSKLNFA